METIEITVNFDYKPSPAQQRVHDSKARYRVINHGIRFGGDYCAIMDGLKYFIDCLNEKRDPNMNPAVMLLIVCPKSDFVIQSWRFLKSIFPKELVDSISNDERKICTIYNGLIEVVDGSDPETLTGCGFDVATITNASLFPRLMKSWCNLEMRLNSPGRGLGGVGGKAVIASSGKKSFEFLKMVDWGDRHSPAFDPDFESFTFTTWDNPMMEEKENEKRCGFAKCDNGTTYKERLYQQLGAKRYRRDVLAQFIDLDEPQEYVVPMDFAHKIARFAAAMSEFESAYVDLFGKGVTARATHDN